MAFCSNCGNQLNDNAKFCAQCGTVVVSKPSGTSVTPAAPPTSAPSVAPAATPVAPGPAPSAPPSFPPTPPPPAAVIPVHYVQPGQVPMGVPVPPPVQPAQNKNGLVGTIVVLALVAGIGYYYYSKTHPSNGGSNPPVSSQPQPQPQPQQTPPPSPGGGNGGGNPNAALLQAQQLNAEWRTGNGFVLVDAKWTNTSSTNLASAVMECDQYNATGADLSQYRMTLNGPTPPNTWSSYSNVQMGEAANGVNKLVCNLVHVTPSN